jgi:hypothetical protein
MADLRRNPAPTGPGAGGSKKIMKVRVVRIKGKEEILERLKTVLSGLEYETSYDEVEGEEGNVIYRYEELHVIGYVDSVYVVVTCDSSECKVEAPIYNYLVEPCHSKPVPSDVVKCVRTVADNTRKVEGLIKELQAMAQELAQHGFEVNNVLGGAEAYWSKVKNNTKSYIRVHLSPRTSILQFQVEAEPAKIIGVAKKVVEEIVDDINALIRL